MEKNPKVSVIIPTMSGREELLQKLLSTIPSHVFDRSGNNSDIEVIVVDDEGLLLAAKRNKGARQAKGEYLLFIDDDNYLKESAISEMTQRFTEEIGVMGMMACYSDKKMRVADGGSMRCFISGFTVGMNTNFKSHEVLHYLKTRSEVANAFMIPRNVFEDVGGFDEKNFPIDLDEADICKRIIDMGFEVVINPWAICYHKSQTYSCIPDFRRPMNAYFMGRNRILFQKKHLNKLQLSIYFLVFFPIFVSSYCASLLYRRKPWMVVHFLKGVFDGLFGRSKNPYQ